MVKSRPSFKWDRYAKIEIVFFACLWIIIPMLSDLEYGLKEEPTQLSNNNYQTLIIQRIVWGVFMIVPFYAFYKLAIQRLLVKKKYLYFLLSTIVFIAFLEFYTLYVMYWSISKSGFLPDVMVEEASKWMKHKSLLHFTISYLILQLLEMMALAYFIDYDKQEKRIMEMQRIQTETDLQYLKAQLQPHFFFNTLNNIYSLALQRSELTAPLVAQLSSMMRYVLYETTRPEPVLEDELNFLKNYMEVQSIRYNKNFDFHFEVQGVNPELKMESLLLFPFIENAFKHGIQEDESSGFIRVIVCLNGNEVVLSVSNSKSDKHNNRAHTRGIGILNTQKRLELLYPGKHELTIQETTDSYSVLLTISIN